LAGEPGSDLQTSFEGGPRLDGSAALTAGAKHFSEPLSEARHYDGVKQTLHLSQSPWAAWEYLRRPVWLFDPVALRGVYANPAALALWGAASLEELLARDFTALSPTVRARTDRLASATIDGTEISERWTFYPNGHPVTVQAMISTYRLPDGAPVLLFEAAPVDAEAEERRALEALRHTSTLISLLDHDGRPLFANPAAYATYGRGDLPLGSRLAEPERAQLLLSRAIAGEPATDVCKMITRQGHRWHHLDARPGLDPVTGATTILLNERDVTETVEAQAAQAAAERKVATAEARQSFLTEMSHELRTPLNAVLGFSELLAGSGLGEEQAEQAARIREGGQRLLSVINEMIRVSDEATVVDRSAAAPLSETPTSSVEPDDRPTRVLYVDDNEVNRRLVVTILRSQGMVCETATNGGGRGGIGKGQRLGRRADGHPDACNGRRGGHTRDTGARQLPRRCAGHRRDGQHPTLPAGDLCRGRHERLDREARKRRDAYRENVRVGGLRLARRL
jgi:PAS domain-containing protein